VSAPSPRRDGLPGFDPVTRWLIVVAAMVFIMVVLGGITRLTQSGLSMVDWQPIKGILPPLSEAAWREAFNAYRQFPEYQKLNFGMTLAEFEAIFLMEWFHRLWGRLIGLAFALPLAWFVLRGYVRGRLARALGGLLLLGGAQGVMGWVMVRSGLIDIPSVSPYRLAAHLALAIIIYLWLLWLILARTRRPAHDGTIQTHARATLALALVTVLAGAFVAGLDAGMAFNTFPLMDGQWVPDGLIMPETGWRNPFENVTMVQFNHRVLAIATLIAAGILVLRGRGAVGAARTAAYAAGAMALVQVGIGITTLLLVVPVWAGALHQTGALILIGLLIWAVFESRRPPA
jgi:cytochrome c oxidase assembly protein subunit 15